MSEPLQVEWHKIALIGLPEMRCETPVNADGHAIDSDGEPLEMSERPNKCGADGRWMLGSVFLCQRHATEVARMLDDDIGAIEEAWKAELLPPCPRKEKHER
jgi:hypothetical protein